MALEPYIQDHIDTISDPVNRLFHMFDRKRTAHETLCPAVSEQDDVQAALDKSVNEALKAANPPLIDANSVHTLQIGSHWLNVYLTADNKFECTLLDKQEIFSWDGFVSDDSDPYVFAVPSQTIDAIAGNINDLVSISGRVDELRSEFTKAANQFELAVVNLANILSKLPAIEYQMGDRTWSLYNRQLQAEISLTWLRELPDAGRVEVSVFSVKHKQVWGVFSQLDTGDNPF